jgi:hypothetical protein
MRYLVITLGLVISVNSFAEVSRQQVREVFTKLVKSGGGYKKYPRLGFTYDRATGGTAGVSIDNTAVLVNPNFLKQIRNIDELAWVLGHELQHIKDHDNRNPNIKGRELTADIGGALWAKRAGYNMCRGVKLLQTFGPDKNHPDPGLRYNLVKCKE